MLCSTILKFLLIFVVDNAVIIAQRQRPSIGTGEYSGSFQNGNINSMYRNYDSVRNPNNSPFSNYVTSRVGYDNPNYHPYTSQILNPSRSPSFGGYTTQAPRYTYTTEKYTSLLYPPSRWPSFPANPYRTTSTTQAPRYSYTTENYPSLTEGERILRSITCDTSIGIRISNGEIASLSEFPWMVVVLSSAAESRERFIGAGTLISNRYVLSAAHCLQSKYQVHFVRLGEHDLSQERDCDGSMCARYKDVAIESITKHPDFVLETLENDIALIRLAEWVDFNSYIKPVCLPLDAHVNSPIPANLIVAGWGKTERGLKSNVKRKANVQLQPSEVCRNIFHLSTSDHICAGSSNGSNKCRGDSGGPLFAAVDTVYVQYGIASGGNTKCGNRYNFPGIYTNVGKYIRWIMNNIVH